MLDMDKANAEIYFEEVIDRFKPYINHAIEFGLPQRGSVMELSSGEGLISQRFFHDKFKRIELLDLIDHSSTIKQRMPLTDFTRKVKFIQAPIQQWTPLDKFDFVFGSYTLALMNDQGVKNLLRKSWSVLRPRGMMIFKEAVVDRRMKLSKSQQTCRTHAQITALFEDYDPNINEVFFKKDDGNNDYEEALIICYKR